MCVCIYILFFIIQRVKARAIPCRHQPPTRGDNTVYVYKYTRNIYIYIYNGNQT